MARPGDVGNLHNKSEIELLEILQRQEKLLSNKKFINTLKDKGEKIKKFKAELEKVLSLKNEIDQTAGLLSKLVIQRHRSREVRKNDLDSDDEEEDPDKDPDIWTTLATQNGTAEKKIIVEECRKEDSNKAMIAKLTRFVDKSQETATRSKFQTNRSLRTGCSPKHTSADNSKAKPLVEENSAVCFPIGPHEKAKFIGVAESVELLQQHIANHKDLELKQAAQRLMERMNITQMDSYYPDPETRMRYRDSQEIEDEDELDDESEVILDEDTD